MHGYRKQQNILDDQSLAASPHLSSSVFMNGRGIFPQEGSMGVVAPVASEL